TKASFTDRQAMVSTPFAFKASAFCTKPGRCLAEQVGVNAPGKAKNATFLPLNRSSVEMSRGPSLVMILSFIDGILSPTLIMCVVLLRRELRSARHYSLRKSDLHPFGVSAASR